MKKPLLIFALALIAGLIFLSAEFERDIELAERYIILNRYLDAKEILERLQRTSPNDARVLMNLRKVYFTLKEYDKLIPLLQTQLLQNPRSVELNLELGRIYLAQGKPNEAKPFFMRAGELSDDKERIFSTVGEYFLNWGFFDDGIKFIEDARKELKNNALFALLLGDLYSFKGELNKALEEYLRDITNKPADEPVILDRLKEFGKNDSDLVRLSLVVTEFLKQGKNKRFLLNLLYQTKLRLDDIDGAFESLKKLEEIEQDSGRRIVEFGYSLERKRAFDALIKVAEYLLNRYGAGYPYLSGQLLMGIAKRESGKKEDAVKIFSDLASLAKTGMPGSIEKEFGEKALYELAKTYIYSSRDYKRAEDLLEEVVKGVRFWTPSSKSLALLLVEAYIRDERIDDALDILVSLSRVFPLDNEIAFKLGELYLFKGELDKGKAILTGMVSKEVRDIYVNDALEYLMLLNYPESARIIKALFWGKTGRYADALDILATLEKGELKEFVLWRESLFLTELKEHKKAMEKLQMLIDSSPESFYTPLAIELQGDILVKEGNIRGGVAKYESIITKYPKAINVENIRAKLRGFAGVI